MKENIYRLHYRGHLKENVSMEEVQRAADLCVQNIRRAQEQGKVLTAALYYSGRMLFFYYEALGELLPVAEYWGIKDGIIAESGEDVQTTCLHPEELLEPLSPFLQIWPGQEDDRLWAYMYHVYCHNIPESVGDWTRPTKPELRRGRIAFLRWDKVMNYVFYHKALVDEGLLLGDKYQSIALHENVLFSYFEEPTTITNVLRDITRKSEVIHQWHEQDPRWHFIHQEAGEGLDFMFLPELFAVGVED